MARSVAGGLRREREDRGLSLAELSRQSGVSRAMISQIETGKTTPTVTVLWKIVTALGVPFSALLGESEPPAVTIVRRTQTRTIESAGGALVSRPLFLPSRGRHVEVYELTLAPRGRVASPPHAPGTVELLVVTRGALHLEVGADSHALRTGDAIEFRADVPHSYINPSARACQAHDVIVYP